MWALAKLKTALDDQCDYFRLADDIGFEQVMVGDIIVMDRVRMPERMLVTAFDETNKLVKVQRGYHGTTPSAWKKGSQMRIFRILNGVAESELVFDDKTEVDGTVTKDVISESYLVYEWQPEDTCLPGCYWLEFKLLKMIDVVFYLPGGNWTGETHQHTDGFFYTGSTNTESSVRLSYNQVENLYLLPDTVWAGEVHDHSGMTFTGEAHNDGSVLLNQTGVPSADDVSFNEEGMALTGDISLIPSFTDESLTPYYFGCILGEGVDHVFGLPGDYVLDFYKELWDSDDIDVINCTDENHAGFAADAYARVHGAGCVCITYNVGALKVANAVACAYAERSPLIVISGAPGIKERSEDMLLHHMVGNFNSQHKMFQEITCASVVIDNLSTAAYQIDYALERMKHYKRPIYIELPRDLSKKSISYDVYKQGTPKAPVTDQENLEEAIDEIQEWLKGSERPAILAGVELARYNLGEKLVKFAERHDIPVATTLLSKSVMNERHPLFAGIYSGDMSHQHTKEIIEDSDCLIMLGVMLTDMTLCFKPSRFKKRKVVSSTIEGLQVRNHTFESVQFGDFCSELLKLDLERQFSKGKSLLPKLSDVPTFVPKPETNITVARLFEKINSTLDKDMAIVADIGDSLFGAADLQVHHRNHFLSPAFYTSMGSAIPGALGVQTAMPDVRPIVVVGDGAFQMAATELSTIINRGLNPIVFVLNNQGYTTERYLLDGEFNDLRNWNYHEITQLFGGGEGRSVVTEEELEEVVTEALDSKGLFVINVNIGAKDISQGPKKDFVRHNHQIRVPNVRLVKDGENLGVVPVAQAQSEAKKAGLDLVEVAPNARPPVCAIMDYGKYMFERSKKAKENKASKQKEKEISFRYVISGHDLETKANQARKFLEKGDRVKLVVKFKKREKAHKNQGWDAIKNMIELLSDVAVVEKEPAYEGGNIAARLELKKESKIDSDGDVRESKSDFLQRLTVIPEDNVKTSLGNFGVRLLAFASEVDFAHPDLGPLFDEEGFGEAALSLAEFSHHLDNDFVTENLSRVLVKHPRHKVLTRIIDAPTKNFRHARFVKSEHLEEIRSIKRTQHVDLRVMDGKGEGFWDECPDDFSTFIRGFNRLKPFVEEATAQHERFTSFGLTSMAREIEDQLNKIVSEADDETYYEFNRITMTTAAVILGHMLNAKYKLPDYRNSSGYYYLSTSQFSGDKDDHYDNIRKLTDAVGSTFRYRPIVIPPCQMDRKPADMVSLLQRLDSMPEVGGRPIFDNYWVMLPEMNLIGDWAIMYDLIEEEKLTGWIGQGPKVEEFEKSISNYLKIPDQIYKDTPQKYERWTDSESVLAVNSCTSAMELALHLVNDGCSDGEIITNPISCFASVSAILSRGLKPRFADIDPETGNLDLEDVMAKCNRNTLAILAVHFCGQPHDLQKLYHCTRTRIRHGKNIWLIEDCAHSLGSVYKGGMIGSHTKDWAFYQERAIKCLSFQSVKTLTTGDGGAIILPDKEMYDRAKKLRWYGLDRSQDRYEQDIEESGFKFSMNDISATIGLSNMDRLQYLIETQRSNWGYYYTMLSDFSDVKLMKRSMESSSACPLFPIRVKDREAFQAKMASKGIQTSPPHGAGFVGSHLVDLLLDQEYEVDVIDDFSTGKKSNLNSKANVIYSMDVKGFRYSSEFQKPRNYDVIFHLAAQPRIQPSFDDPAKTHDSNVTGTLSILEYARRCSDFRLNHLKGLKKTRVVYAGSSTFYHDVYANPYAFCKHIGEEYCKLYNKVYDIPVSIARFFNVYGPRQLDEGAYATVVGVFERQAKAGEKLTVTGDGEQRRDFTHVKDIVSGLLAMSEKDWNGEVFPLGTGMNHSINELAQMFNREYIHIPKRPGEAQETRADISFTKEKLGWNPVMSLEEYVKDAVCSQESE
ncbi:unnamed protein product [Symbiodinium microadriaticum]|nr:unnamed protein product [Symbiodinium microadriaticum]